jgi:cytochrome c
MKRLLAVAVVALGLPAGAVLAQSDALRARGCLTCHEMDRQKVGPSLRDIAARHKGDKSKAGDIVARMKEGKGHPKVAGSDAELRSAVEAALSAR